MKTTQIRRATIAGWLALTLAGCVTAPPAQTRAQSEKTAIYQATYDQTWGAIVAEFTGSYPFEMLQKESGIVQTKTLVLDSGPGAQFTLEKLAYPPKSFLATYNGANFVIYMVVSKEDEAKTKVLIRCTYTGHENNVSGAWLIWESNGVMEQKLMNRITTRLGKTPIAGG